MELTHIAKVLMQTGLTPIGFGILMAVNEGAKTQVHIARKVEASTASISESLRAMEDHKLVTLSRSTEDRRVVIPTITQEGKALLHRVSQAFL